MRLLDLFCGAGGAGWGYHLAGFEVVGVDIHRQADYPFQCIRHDAMTFPLEGFDAIHASPPCPAYSTLTKVENRDRYDDLLTETIERLTGVATPWIVENVRPGVFPGIQRPVRLCGTAFNLTTADGAFSLRRHRYFASNVQLVGTGCDHKLPTLGVYGSSDGQHAADHVRATVRTGPRQATNDEAREMMQMPWPQTRRGITDAIPPAYTRFLGEQLMTHINYWRAAYERPTPVLGSVGDGQPS